MPDARPTWLLVLGCAFSSCAGAPPAPTVEITEAAPIAPDTRAAAAPGAEATADTPARPSAGSVVLVTLDGVRWQEIFTGADPALADGAEIPGGEARTARALTPNLHRLFFDGGVVLGDPRLGAPFTASGPNFVSLPGYVEIMTGAPSGCGGNDCDPRLPWSIAGEIARAAPPGGEAAAVFSSWGRIARAVPAHAAGLVTRTGRDPGEQAPAYPGDGDYRPDRRTAALAIDHLVHHRPRFLWIALGDTDEWAHAHDYRGYLDALRFADGVIGEISAHLDEMGPYGAGATLLVTADHGRDPGFADHGGPASAGVWLMARGGPVARRGPTPLPRVRHLSDVAPTIAALLGTPGRRCAGCGEVLDALW